MRHSALVLHILIQILYVSVNFMHYTAVLVHNCDCLDTIDHILTRKQSYPPSIFSLTIKGHIILTLFLHKSTLDIFILVIIPF